MPALEGDPRCTIVIPFYNEGPNVATLLNEVRGVMREVPIAYEILAINDGSTDDTKAELYSVMSTWRCLRVIDLQKNSGQAAALWTGFKQARGGVIVTMDGDGQNDPADIPRILEAVEHGADMVAGIRATRRDSLLRKLMSRLANAVRNLVLHDGIRDSGCALKGFRREVCGSFIPIRTLYSFMPALAKAAGYRIEQLPVNHRERTAGRSKYGLGVMLWRPVLDMLGIWWFSSRRFQGGAAR
ncbi:glycosyltransferase family 2 protein [Roseimicrobium sp. ORNL1]|uniref:glycosyltransferase family 2 protein n=1 Tax=Roseimicrobium sp. ORNL1 TaxID=2711231 RepID=UPI0013E1BDDE|nr:glycosyltransferase family 2 protein [Roseimicrobium sp. ORNL1]QIF03816.1 glycosyltransferase family 2 protein [Roseimicrobium sp. ORNL1]